MTSIEHTVTVALDKDAYCTVELEVEPILSCNVRPTSLLLIHMIPTTASLSHTLQHLLEVESFALSRLAEEKGTDTKNMNGCNNRSLVNYSNNQIEKTYVESSESEQEVEVQNGKEQESQNEFIERLTLNEFAMKFHQEEGNEVKSKKELEYQEHNVHEHDSCSNAHMYDANTIIKFVRVCYVTNEIQAYALLVECVSKEAAQALRNALIERQSGPSMKTPVEFIHGKCNVVIHCCPDTNETDPNNNNNTKQSTSCITSGNRNNMSSSNLHNNTKNNKERRWEERTYVRIILHSLLTNCWRESSNLEEFHKPSHVSARTRTLANSSSSSLSHSSSYSSSSSSPRSCTELSKPSNTTNASSALVQTQTSPSTLQLLPSSLTTSITTKEKFAMRKKYQKTTSSLSSLQSTPLLAPRTTSSRDVSDKFSKNSHTTRCHSSSFFRTSSSSSFSSSHSSLSSSNYSRIDELDCERNEFTSLPLRPIAEEELCAICQCEPLHAKPCMMTLCQHMFHLKCYARVPSTSAECPLCRFSLYDLLTSVRCEVCRTFEDLWVCLICGFVGCGGGRRKHAQAHREQTSHSCMLQCSTNRIWNNTSRMFLHQEVAMLLDQDSNNSHQTNSKTDCTRSDNGKKQSEHQLESKKVNAPRKTSWLWWNTHFDSSEDEEEMEMRAALTESTEEAVRAYYVNVLHSLVEEQQRYFDSIRAKKEQQTMPHNNKEKKLDVKEKEIEVEVNKAQTLQNKEFTRKQEEHNKITNTKNVKSVATLNECNISTLHSTSDNFKVIMELVRKEEQGRAALVQEYVKQTRELVSNDNLQLRSLIRQQRAWHEQLQEEVLLKSHHNTGLQQKIATQRQRLSELQKRTTEQNETAKQREVELQKQIDTLLNSLH